MPWSRLKNGDIVDVVAPGFSFRWRDLENSKKILENWGLKARVPANIMGPDLICANSVENRWRTLKEALYAKDSSAIWFVRGGYGSVHLLPYLARLKKKPIKTKAVLGLSDVTALHWYLNDQWNWSTLHAPLFSYIGNKHSPGKAVNELKRVLLSDRAEVAFEKLRPLNLSALQSRSMNSKVIGGNFAVITSLIGTPFFSSKKKKILFLEDVGERAYRLDRMVQQWKLSGAFSGVQAIVFGQVTEGRDPDGVDRTKKWMKLFAEQVKVPVLSGVESGHGKLQRPVPLNTKCRLTLGKKPLLVCDIGKN